MSHGYTRPYNPDGVQAYFISFRCYGTWLHGSDRGSTDRLGHNAWGTLFLPADANRETRERVRLKHPPVILSDDARAFVTIALRTACNCRSWLLHAVNVQPDHVHVVLTAPEKPEPVMNSLKSWATRRLREEGLAASESRVWSWHGSTIWLWTEEQVRAACAYVVDGQPLPPDVRCPP